MEGEQKFLVVVVTRVFFDPEGYKPIKITGTIGPLPRDSAHDVLINLSKQETTIDATLRNATEAELNNAFGPKPKGE